MFYEIGVPKSFAKFTGKNLCWSHFFPGQLLLEHIKCNKKDDLSNRKVPVLEYGYLLGIGRIRKTGHLASCNNFTRDVKDVKEMLRNIRKSLSPS